MLYVTVQNTFWNEEERVAKNKSRTRLGMWQYIMLWWMGIQTRKLIVVNFHHQDIRMSDFWKAVWLGNIQSLFDFLIYFELPHGGAISFQWVHNPKLVTMATGSACHLCLEQKTSIWCVKIMDLSIITIHVTKEKFHYLNKNLILNLMLRPLKLRTLITEISNQYAASWSHCHVHIWVHVKVPAINAPKNTMSYALCDQYIDLTLVCVPEQALSLNCLQQQHVNTMRSYTSV